jgi:hypothetical protein
MAGNAMWRALSMPLANKIYKTYAEDTVGVSRGQTRGQARSEPKLRSAPLLCPAFPFSLLHFLGEKTHR